MIRTTTRVIFALYLASLTVGSAMAGEGDSTGRAMSVNFRPLIRSVQLDGTVFLYGTAYGGSADIDFLQLHTPRLSSIGVRLGLERVAVGGPGGSLGGSPYLDYCSLVRLSLLGNLWRFDALLGYAYQRSDLPDAYPSRGILKSGAQLRWRLAPGLFGLMLKGNAGKSEAFIGIGIYGGWEE